MPPTALFTVIAPSASVQVAGDRSFIRTHSSRLAPLNNTIASDGGEPLVPGVTTAGTGDQISVSSGLVGTCPPAAAVVDAGALCGVGWCPAQPASPSAPTMVSESNDSRVYIE